MLQPSEGQPNKEWLDKKKDADAELKQALGEQRYAEYQKAQDYEYQNLVNLVETRGLERTVLDQIQEMKAAAQKAAADLRRNKELSEDQRNAALAAMRAETERSVAATLGEKNFKAYKRHSGWMRSLAPPQTVTINR